MKRLFYLIPFSRNLLTPLLSVVTAIMILTGCSSSKHASSSKHRGKTPTRTEISTKGLSKERRLIVEEALKWEGTPYKYAGAERGKGTDCSGMVLAVYRDVANVLLPRNSAKQAEFCHKLNKKEVRPGDLVFFATGKDPKRISHVGIMLDDDNFIHASTSKGVVISQVSTPYYVRTFKGYGRALN